VAHSGGQEAHALPSIRQVGWFIVFLGALSELVYHGPQLLFSYQWPATIATIGEFGHTVVFVGIIVLIYSVLRQHRPASS
jgi:hypothetical protein